MAAIDEHIARRLVEVRALAGRKRVAQGHIFWRPYPVMNNERRAVARLIDRLNRETLVARRRSIDRRAVGNVSPTPFRTRSDAGATRVVETRVRRPHNSILHVRRSILWCRDRDRRRRGVD